LQEMPLGGGRQSNLSGKVGGVNGPEEGKRKVRCPFGASAWLERWTLLWMPGA
jgi:hypothetical protein